MCDLKLFNSINLTKIIKVVAYRSAISSELVWEIILIMKAKYSESITGGTEEPIYPLMLRELLDYDRQVSYVDHAHKYLNQRKATLDDLEDKAHSWKRIFVKELDAAIACARRDVEESRLAVEDAEEKLVKSSQQLDVATEAILAKHNKHYRAGSIAKNYLNPDLLQPVIDNLERFRPCTKIVASTLSMIHTYQRQEFCDYAVQSLKKAIMAAEDVDKVISEYNERCEMHQHVVRSTAFEPIQIPRLALTGYGKRLDSIENIESDTAKRILKMIDRSIGDLLEKGIPELRSRINISKTEHEALMGAMVRHAWANEWIRWRELPEKERYASMQKAG